MCIRDRKNTPLTLSPGVTIVFSEGAGLKLDSERSLRAVGTASNPIIFTGEKKTPGAWHGVEIHGQYADLELEHVVIEYAGAAGLLAESPTTLKMNHVTLRNNAGVGFDLYPYYSQAIVRNCTVTGNGGRPMELSGDLSKLAGVFDNTSTFKGNGTDCIGNSGQKDSSLPTPDVPYCG